MVKLFYDIIGCGAVVQQYHLPVVLYFKRKYKIFVRGCFDINIENARKVGRLLKSSMIGRPADIEDITAVDAALIATPPDSHAELITKYITEGKTIFVEKPFVTHAHDAKGLLALAAENRAKILVGNFRRFYPSVIIAKEVVTSGVLGDIDRVVASEGSRWEWPASPYVVESGAGGVIYDKGSHLLDMALFILSLDQDNFDHRIERIEKKPVREPSHECRAAITINSRSFSNLRLDLILSRIEPVACIVKIYGTRGMLMVPTAFSLLPILECENKDSILKSLSRRTGALDETGCFLLEHLELLDYLLQRSTKRSVLEADFFVSLVTLLESLTKHGG